MMQGVTTFGVPSSERVQVTVGALVLSESWGLMYQVFTLSLLPPRRCRVTHEKFYRRGGRAVWAAARRCKRGGAADAGTNRHRGPHRRLSRRRQSQKGEDVRLWPQVRALATYSLMLTVAVYVFDSIRRVMSGMTCSLALDTPNQLYLSFGCSLPRLSINKIQVKRL